MTIVQSQAVTELSHLERLYLCKGVQLFQVCPCYNIINKSVANINNTQSIFSKKCPISLTLKPQAAKENVVCEIVVLRLG